MYPDRSKEPSNALAAFFVSLKRMKTRSSSRSTTISSAEAARSSMSGTRGTSNRRRRPNRDDCSLSKRADPGRKGAAAATHSLTQTNVTSGTPEVQTPSSPPHPTFSADYADNFGLGASDYYSVIEQWLEANEPPRNSLPEAQSPEDDDDEVYKDMLAKYTNHSDLMEWE